MARGDHGLPKVLLGPALPDPSMPCGWATPVTVLRPFQGWPARRAGGLRPSFTHLNNTPRGTPTILPPSPLSTLEGRPSAYNFDQSPELQDFVTAVSIRITLDRINSFGDEVFGDPKVS
jgi:hypothetical protein